MSLRIVPLLCLVALSGSAVSVDLLADEHPRSWAELAAQRKSKRAQRQAQPADETEPVTLFYSVADLVIPIPAVVTAGFDVPAETPQSLQAEFKPLIEKIKAIEPSTWTEAGGVGTVQPYATTLSLVVRQTQAVHDKIVTLLSHLRREQDIQVGVEIRLVEVPDRFSERVGIDFDFTTGETQASEKVGMNFDFTHEELPLLDADELKTLLETVQQDPRSNLLSSPKVTLFNGQTLWLNKLAEEDDSLVLNADISSDRRTIKLTVATRGNKDGKSVVITRTARVPDGLTFLVNCGPVPQKSSGVPMPVMAPRSRLFTRKTSQHKPSHRVLMITPRMVVQEEEEELLGIPVEMLGVPVVTEE